MYYFGTNLDERFNVPDFWPKPEQTYKIPYEREEISNELDRLKRQRLYKREMRLISEGYSEEEISAALQAPELVGGRKGRRRAGEKEVVGGPLDREAARISDGLRGWFGLGRRTQ